MAYIRHMDTSRSVTYIENGEVYVTTFAHYKPSLLQCLSMWWNGLTLKVGSSKDDRFYLIRQEFPFDGKICSFEFVKKVP